MSLASSRTVVGTTLLNLTPHNVVVYPANSDTQIIYPKSTATVARLTSIPQTFLYSLEDDTPVFTPQRFIGITPAAPPYEEGHVGCIVSMPAAIWLQQNLTQQETPEKWRSVFVADTGPGGAVRNEQGVIIGTQRLVEYPLLSSSSTPARTKLASSQ